MIQVNRIWLVQRRDASSHLDYPLLGAKDRLSNSATREREREGTRRFLSRCPLSLNVGVGQPCAGNCNLIFFVAMSRGWRRVKSRDTRAVPFEFLERKSGNPHSCSRRVKLRVSPYARPEPAKLSTVPSNGSVVFHRVSLPFLFLSFFLFFVFFFFVTVNNGSIRSNSIEIFLFAPPRFPRYFISFRDFS